MTEEAKRDLLQRLKELQLRHRNDIAEIIAALIKIGDKAKLTRGGYLALYLAQSYFGSPGSSRSIPTPSTTTISPSGSTTSIPTNEATVDDDGR
jgi:hypothetical protein